MIDLSNVALFIADTRDHQLAINTIAHCCKNIKFGQIIFLTNKTKEELDLSKIDQPVDLHLIETIYSPDEYSHLVLFKIRDKLDTVFRGIKYVMIVQTDGFVVNTEAWNPQFLDCDYIGAPWKYFPSKHEPPYPPSTPDTCVGNGGFSIRSVKLIETVMILLDKRLYNKITPEDLFICITLKPELNQLGIKFAPEWLASTFSCENRLYTNQFGFHGNKTYQMNPQLPRLK